MHSGVKICPLFRQGAHRLHSSMFQGNAIVPHRGMRGHTACGKKEKGYGRKEFDPPLTNTFHCFWQTP